MMASRPFIPAKPNRLVIGFFKYFTRLLAGRQFHAVYLENEYHDLQPGKATLYFGNHNAWWDALTPLLLNEYVLKQKPYAVMEWQQVHDYPFFRRFGCFSIDRDDPRSALKSLQYGIDWLNGTPGASLYLYPEGRITNPQQPAPAYETGIGWMHSRLDPQVDMVPLIQHMHFMHHAKPSLFLRLGPPVKRTELPENKKAASTRLQEIAQNEQQAFIQRASEKEPAMPRLF